MAATIAGWTSRFGFGIRQSERGGGSYVPWFNAPPGTDQRLGVFYLLSDGNAEQRIDRKPCATRTAIASPSCRAITRLPATGTWRPPWRRSQEKANGDHGRLPDLVPMFKNMGVEIVHLAEFHGDGHPQDPGPMRLPEMEAMFAECKRLSDGEILFLPGEEANIALGTARPGKEAGHWLYLFPRPVYWTMKRAPGQPFVENSPPFGTVYHVGNGSRHGQAPRAANAAWPGPRTPGSRARAGRPTSSATRTFYQSNLWLGAAWKAMPADLSLDKLGHAALDLLDDMANWGQKKYLPGEVDVFKIDHTHELYGHMNINYITLEPDRVPRFDEGWQPVLDALRSGRFFVTTGEVLIPEFQVAGKSSGSTVALEPGKPVEVQFQLIGTFPLRFAEIISGDGSHVFRDRIDLAETGSFSQQRVRRRLDLSARKWVRLEAWDVATNGSYTQPVWLETAPSR